MGTLIYFAAVTVMLYLGEWLGSRGGQLALRMAMNREEASWRPTLVRTAMSAPPLSTFERGLFIVLIMAVLFAIPSETLIERVFLFFFCGLAYSLLQLGFSHWAPLQALFGTAAPDAFGWALVAACGVLVLALVEAEKWLLRLRRPARR